MDPHQTDTAARTVGRYEILRQIGQGGMATVYLARQTGLDREVALKKLERFGVADQRVFTSRFVREAKLAGSLGHPNIGGVVGLRARSRVRLVCVGGCVRRLSAVGTASARGRLRLTLKRPLRLARGTRIELRVSLGGYVTRFQRYRFRRTRTGTLGRFVSSGCLATEKPRLVVRCPRT